MWGYRKRLTADLQRWRQAGWVNAEGEARNAAMNAFLATTDRAMQAGSGERAKYRHRMGSALMQEQVWRR